MQKSKITLEDMMSVRSARDTHTVRTSGNSGRVEMLGPANGEITYFDGTYSAVSSNGVLPPSNASQLDAARPSRPKTSGAKRDVGSSTDTAARTTDDE